MIINNNEKNKDFKSNIHEKKIFSKVVFSKNELSLPEKKNLDKKNFPLQSCISIPCSSTMKSQVTLKDDNLSSMQNTKPFFVTNQYNTSHDTANKNYRDELSFKQANINFESLKKGDRLNMEQSFSNLHDGYFNKNSEC